LLPDAARPETREDPIGGHKANMPRQLKTALLVATCDTKADEVRYLREELVRIGGAGRIMDVGVLVNPASRLITQYRLLLPPGRVETRRARHKNQAMTRMAVGAVVLKNSKNRAWCMR
jgi:uncharacterized protein (UPF0261 family)